MLMKPETSKELKSVQEQANLWITRLDKGISSVEKQQLIAWINQDNSHYAALKKMSFLWQDIATKHDLNGLFAQKPVKKAKSDYLLKGGLAAGLMFLALLTANLFHDVNNIWLKPQYFAAQQSTYQKYSSQYGEQKQLTLDDGSIVALNSNTAIEVAYSQQQRKVTIIRGEAKFDVAKDINRPFSVISGYNSFTALGTVFNVQRNNISSVELLVEEGSVLVAEANTPVNTLIQTIKSAKKQTIQQQSGNNNVLTAGEKLAIVNDVKSVIRQLSTQEVEQELAWQQGILIFDGEPLEQVLQEVQRYNPIKFMPIDAELAKLKVSGYFKTNDVNGLLQSLHYNFAILVEETTSNTYALSSTPHKT
jgi:transmembrane sensor